jgi:bifunctional non-homologous end joining protein LigD
VPISLAVTPHLVASTGLRPLEAAIAEPLRYAVERKVDGVRGLVTFAPDGTLTTRNRRGEVRGWLRRQPLAVELRALGRRLPILHDGTVLDGELVADRFAGTMAALMGSKAHGDALRFVVFDVPILAGVDFRAQPWEARRERLELLARAFTSHIVLSPLVEPSEAIAREMADGITEGIVLKDRRAPYRDGSRAGWWKVKDRSWFEREAWPFDRR